MNDTKSVKGLTDLSAAFKSLPAKMEANVMRGGMRAGAKVLESELKANIRSASGDLAASARVTTKAKGGTVSASAVVGVSKKFKRPFYAHMLEEGTKAHVIRAKRVKRLAFGTSKVNHPGAKAQHPGKRALASKAGAAINATVAYLRERLSTKHGIDVPAPMEEGDE